MKVLPFPSAQSFLEELLTKYPEEDAPSSAFVVGKVLDTLRLGAPTDTWRFIMVVSDEPNLSLSNPPRLL
jgi:hypothetical protein